MALPQFISILYYLYGGLVVLLMVFGVINIFQLVWHSTITKVSVLMTLIFIVGFSLTLMTSIQLLSNHKISNTNQVTQPF